MGQLSPEFSWHGSDPHPLLGSAKIAGVVLHTMNIGGHIQQKNLGMGQPPPPIWAVLIMFTQNSYFRIPTMGGRVVKVGLTRVGRGIVDVPSLHFGHFWPLSKSKKAMGR